MKKIYSILYIFIGLLIITNANAQTIVTSSGISIQGIARDENNAALANIDQLNLAFTIYYLGTGNSEQVILTQTANVRTDNFGVFSFVLNIDQLYYNQISTNATYLKVAQGSVVFSNEKLQAVPYSIYAQNGVPTGAIMPFVGTTAPQGWMLCDGSAIPVNANTASLRTLLGTTTTPDLRALFLRGTGNGNGHSGPALKTVQQDDIKSHLHEVNINTDIMGAHNHGNNNNYNRVLKQDGIYTSKETDNTWNQPNLNSSEPIATDGAHSHKVLGNTLTTGGTETRPINYGVNYIIKI